MEDSPPEFIRFHKPAPPRPQVYELALDLVVHVQNILETGAARFRMKDQLDQLTTKIAMCLAHVLEEPPSARWSTYRTALKHANSCATLLDIVARQGVTGEHLDQARAITRVLRAELSTLGLYKV